MKSMKKSLAFFALGAAVTCAVFACIFCTKSGERKMFSKSDFENCKVYVQQFQRDGTFHQQFRDIADQDKRIFQILLRAEKFRPYTTSKIEKKAETTSALGVTVVSKTKRVYIRLFDNPGQLAIDSIHREKPLILVSIATKMDNGGYADAEKWYCYLPPSAYVQLFPAIIGREA